MKIRFCVTEIYCMAFLFSCTSQSTFPTHEKLKSELFKVEKEFCAMAQSEGVKKAFVHFAADSAVILRRNHILKGKTAISQQYETFPGTAKLEWTPDFADISASGDLGYTYGRYSLTTTDSVGHTSRSEGFFHTVWKRQPDGEWRFVWD